MKPLNLQTLLLSFNTGKIEQISSAYELLTKPRNIFVAQFFGNYNLVQVKNENHAWKTPWGEMMSHFDGNEAYLLIPPSAWFESEREEYTIESVKAKFHHTELLVSKDEKQYIAHLPLNQFSSYQKRVRIGLSVKLQDCSLVSL